MWNACEEVFYKNIAEIKKKKINSQNIQQQTRMMRECGGFQ